MAGSADGACLEEPNNQAAAKLAGYEVSPQQRRAWLLQREAGALYARATVEISGTPDVGALRRAATALTAKHEILRTTFRRVPGRVVPVQVIHDDLAPEWREVDLERFGPEAASARVREYLEEVPAFDLERGSLFHLSLLRLAADRCLLSFCLPALCADSTSLRLLIAELAALYDGRHDESDPLQYADLADWQNQLLGDKTQGEAGHAFWRQRDVDDPKISLPFERSPGGETPFRMASYILGLPAATVERLSGASARSEVPPSAILAASWQSLLWRLSGVQDPLVWHVSDGRHEADLENAVGPLARALPLRIRFDTTTPAARLWRRTHRAWQEASRWENYWNLVNVADGVPGSAALPQLGFRFVEWTDRLTAGEVSISPHSETGALEPFKLDLCCVRAGAEIRMEFRYDSRRYREADVRRLAGYYQTLLDSALADPEAAAGSLPLLPESERHQLLVEFNDSHREYPPVAAIHQLFEQQASRNPEALAVVCEEERLTYGELNRRANQLARHLLKRGVGANAPVGLLLERSANMLVGLLGILKAGGAYLPLDPALPKERLAGMLEDSRAEVLLTQRSLSELGLSCSHTVLLDEEWPQISKESEADPQVQVRDEDLVYIIYTSGSTGRPKGVAVEHRNLLNYVLGISERLGLEPGASFATVSTLAADLGNTAVFPSLCNGGVLHVLSSERAMDPQRWREYLEQHPVDCLKVVPSHLQALLGNAEGEAAEAALPKQVLVLGGEASSWELVERIRRAAPSLRVVNHYGPTEATVGVLTYEVADPSGMGGWAGTHAGYLRDSGGGGAGGMGEETPPDTHTPHPRSARVPDPHTHTATVPLGKPLPNSRVYLLNEQREPVPLGVAGELYIGGAGVARGYLNQPELTASRFVQDPFSSDLSSRLYKTGDLGRYLQNGSVEFLGRIDHQVKIRGYRIELGEIESVLAQHPAIREAVVLAREDSPGEKRLAAYVVPTNGAVSASELREHLKQTLPEYMVPSALVSLKGLPLTANGKVDRKALPPPEELEEKQQYVAPRNAVEEVLVGIFEEVLGRERVSVTESFFDLGGHSLLATQVISRVREAFEVDVPLRAVFEAPSVAALAEVMLAEPETRPQIERMAEMLVSLSGLSDEELEERLRSLEAEGAGV